MVRSMDLENKLKNILKKSNIETELPEWSKFYNWNHHSPSQINLNDDLFCFKYFYLTEKERAKFKPNAKMVAGATIGQAVAQIFAKKIYNRNKKQFFKTEETKFDDS